MLTSTRKLVRKREVLSPFEKEIDLSASHALTCQSGPEVDGSSVAFDGLLVEASSLQQNAPATQQHDHSFSARNK
jgi:hypothetical protein